MGTHTSVEEFDYCRLDIYDLSDDEIDRFNCFLTSLQKELLPREFGDRAQPALVMMCIMMLSVFLADPTEGRYIAAKFNARLAYLASDGRGPPIQLQVSPRLSPLSLPDPTVMQWLLVKLGRLWGLREISSFLLARSLSVQQRRTLLVAWQNLAPSDD